jgi:hypothetical protein
VTADQRASLRIGTWLPEASRFQTSLRRAPYHGPALAHPLTQPFGLPVSPLVAGWITVALVLLVAFAVPCGEPGSHAREGGSWAGSLSRPQSAVRVLAVALLVLAVVEGRVGENDELDNLAPALVVGAAWPLLVIASVAVGPVWRWLDPWDGIARVLTRGHADQAARHVWPAALVALPWVWYLSAYGDTLAPRSVGAIVAAYTLFTVAGCLVIGRRRWLSTSEPLGIVLSWMALLPRRRLADWEPPGGAEVLLGVLAGGVLFGAVRRSELWGDLNTARGALWLATLGVMLSAAAVAGLLVVTARWGAERGARAAAARAAVPAVAAIIVAVALDRNRLFTSVQLLPELLGAPFSPTLDPAPLGTRGLLAAQLAVLAAGHAVGAAVPARRFGRDARAPAALGLSLLALASVVALVSH